MRFDGSARTVQGDELGLLAVPAGDASILDEGVGLLSLEPPALLLSTVKPADDGKLLVRVLNPTGDHHRAVLTVGIAATGARSVRLDETADEGDVDVTDGHVRFEVGPHVLRTVLLEH